MSSNFQLQTFFFLEILTSFSYPLGIKIADEPKA